MVGYDRQLNYLDLVIRNGSAPHAFLFHGREAGFMSDLARGFVFRLNFPEHDWASWRETRHPAAAAIKSGTHPDVYVVKKDESKKEIGIAQIRALRDFVAKTAFSLPRKAAIIEEAERLSEESWDALLKTLEEPISGAVLFLIASKIKNVPLTVTSRAVVLSFPVGPEDNRIGRLGQNSDIILSGLTGLDNLSLPERLELAEKISCSMQDGGVEVLDDLMILLRTRLLESNGPTAPAIRKINLAIKAKDILSATNANPRLVWENLLINL